MRCRIHHEKETSGTRRDCLNVHNDGVSVDEEATVVPLRRFCFGSLDGGGTSSHRTCLEPQEDYEQQFVRASEAHEVRRRERIGCTHSWYGQPVRLKTFESNEPLSCIAPSKERDGTVLYHCFTGSSGPVDVARRAAVDVSNPREPLLLRPRRRNQSCRSK